MLKTTRDVPRSGLWFMHASYIAALEIVNRAESAYLPILVIS